MTSRTNTEPTTKPTEGQLVEKLYMENTLLRISDALFCHDAKGAAQRVSKIEINRAVREQSIIIEPHPTFGQPGPLLHKFSLRSSKNIPTMDDRI